MPRYAVYSQRGKFWLKLLDESMNEMPDEGVGDLLDESKMFGSGENIFVVLD